MSLPAFIQRRIKLHTMRTYLQLETPAGGTSERAGANLYLSGTYYCYFVAPWPPFTWRSRAIYYTRILTVRENIGPRAACRNRQFFSLRKETYIIGACMWCTRVKEREREGERENERRLGNDDNERWLVYDDPQVCRRFSLGWRESDRRRARDMRAPFCARRASG